MTLPIGALNGVLGPVGPTAPVDVSGGAGAVTGVGGGDSGANFATELSKGLESLQGLQAKADTLAVQAATGELTDVHDYTIAATQAGLATKLTVAVRDKAVAAFTEIMRMQG